MTMHPSHCRAKAGDMLHGEFFACSNESRKQAAIGSPYRDAPGRGEAPGHSEAPDSRAFPLSADRIDQQINRGRMGVSGETTLPRLVSLLGDEAGAHFPIAPGRSRPCSSALQQRRQPNGDAEPEPARSPPEPERARTCGLLPLPAR